MTTLLFVEERVLVLKRQAASGRNVSFQLNYCSIVCEFCEFCDFDF